MALCDACGKEVEDRAKARTGVSRLDIESGKLALVTGQLTAARNTIFSLRARIKLLDEALDIIREQLAELPDDEGESTS